MKTNVYIDAFNLYFGALKGTPYRWLNIARLCELLLPKQRVTSIKYFTALVKPRPHDPQQPMRQQIYLRALNTLHNVDIILGHFLSHEVWMPLANSSRKKPKYAKVIKTEEKGSDVNLATHLLADAFQNKFEVAVVVSNDSDLVEPIRIVREQLHKKVGVINPHTHPSRELLKYATFFKKIRRGVLQAALFPPQLTDEHGTFKKPESWK